MKLIRLETAQDLAEAAAADAAAAIREAIHLTGRARIVAATGSAQFAFLSVLTRKPGIDWSRVEMFHLDEYIGLPAGHPASFRAFLMERLVRPTGIEKVHFLDGDADPEAICDRVGRDLQAEPIDITFLGIGENGHLAFNDPPADFQTERPYIVVQLDQVCRGQQVGEGWFKKLDDVPARAISMSIRQLLEGRKLLCIVPEERKARAVKAAFEGPISPLVPASILRTHANTTVYLDRESAALLDADLLRRYSP